VVGYLITARSELRKVLFLALSVTFLTCHVTYHVRPHQPIIDQQGLGLRGLVHKEAHPVILTFTNVCLKAFMLGASTAL